MDDGLIVEIGVIGMELGVELKHNILEDGINGFTIKF